MDPQPCSQIRFSNQISKIYSTENTIDSRIFSHEFWSLNRERSSSLQRHNGLHNFNHFVSFHRISLQRVITAVANDQNTESKGYLNLQEFLASSEENHSSSSIIHSNIDNYSFHFSQLIRLPHRSR